MAASLQWADEKGPLEDWTAFAYIPLNGNGCGTFRFTGGRAVPPEATHVMARAVKPDFSGREEILAPIPGCRKLMHTEEETIFCVMSDIHLSSKSGSFRRALRTAGDPDFILLAGDLTNDGKPEQFEQVCRCIEEEAADIPVFAVAGNHDIPLKPLPQVDQSVGSYYRLQDWLCRRARRAGIKWEQDISGAYSAYAGTGGEEIDITGLNAVSHWRRFVFPGGQQLNWLERHLESMEDGKLHIVLCHAPMMSHNPMRRGGTKSPYLSRDEELQQLLDRHSQILFISGHTHISLNELPGCVEYDAGRGNTYVNDACVCPSALHTGETLTAGEWTEGSVMDVRVGRQEIEMIGRSVISGKKISRGYYRISRYI